MMNPNEYKNWETGDMVTPDTDNRLTKPQAERLNQMLRGGRPIESVIVSDGGCLGLPKGYASVAFIGGSVMGIAPDGRGHT
jgi:hypothetical protein